MTVNFYFYKLHDGQNVGTSAIFVCRKRILQKFTDFRFDACKARDSFIESCVTSEFNRSALSVYVSLQETQYETDEVLITMDCTVAGTWCEIDAIKIKNVPNIDGKCSEMINEALWHGVFGRTHLEPQKFMCCLLIMYKM